jgi:hypothetical protein
VVVSKARTTEPIEEQMTIAAAQHRKHHRGEVSH